MTDTLRADDVVEITVRKPIEMRVVIVDPANVRSSTLELRTYAMQPKNKVCARVPPGAVMYIENVATGRARDNSVRSTGYDKKFVRSIMLTSTIGGIGFGFAIAALLFL